MNKPALITLEDWNNKRRLQQVRLQQVRLQRRPEPVRNGLACPECGSELVDSAPGSVLTSNPPQLHVACTECEFTGYRVE